MAATALVSVPFAYSLTGSSPNLLVADPRKPAKRLQKEVLRVGEWHTDKGLWKVTLPLLNEICSQFAIAKKNGVRVPFICDHDNSIRSTIGRVEDFAVRGESLVMTCSVRNKDFQELIEAVDSDCSIKVVGPWMDGAGNSYPIMVEHVGLVNHPVIIGQTPFVELSKRKQKGWSITMAKAKNGDAAEGEDDLMTIAEVVQILRAANVPLKGDPQTKGELTIALAQYGAEEATEDAAAAVPTAGGDTVPAEAMAMSQGRTQGRIVVQDARIAAQLEAANQRAAKAEQQATAMQLELKKQQEAQFCTVLDRLIGEGRIAAGRREGLVKTGATVNFALSMLDVYSDIKPGSVVPVTQQSLALSKSAAGEDEVVRQSTFSGGPRPSAEDCKKAAQKFPSYPRRMTKTG